MPEANKQAEKGEMMHDTLWKKLKWRIANILDRLFKSWCWVDLAQWSWGDRKFRDINRDCQDADRSSQPRCWCNKRGCTQLGGESDHDG